MPHLHFLSASIIALTATSALAQPADVGRTADVYANAVRQVEATATSPDAIFAVSVVARDFGTVDFSGAMETEALKVSLTPTPLTDTEINDALEQEVFQVALDVPHPAIHSRMLAHEDRAFGSDLNAEVLTVAAINDALEQEVFQVALDAPHPAIRSRMLAHEDRAFGGDLNAEVLTVAAINDALEQEVFQVALDAPHPAIRSRMLAHEDRAFGGDLNAEVLTVAAINDALEQEVFQVALDVPQPIAPAVSATSEFVVAVSAEAQVPGDAAASTRQTGQSGSLMSDIAAADENLVMRDGGDDGADTMMMSSDVLFAFGSATLADDALETLAMIGDMSDQVPVIEVFGHTDAIGSETSNRDLGQERAEAVRDWLLQNSAFTEDRLIATGIGETDPVAPNLLLNGKDNPNGRAQNRRVEFSFHEAGYPVK